ncbi:MAG: hypothetical protein AAGN64_00190, partial [Bacteroidota bacterium]
MSLQRLSPRFFTLGIESHDYYALGSSLPGLERCDRLNRNPGRLVRREAKRARRDCRKGDGREFVLGCQLEAVAVRRREQLALVVVATAPHGAD